MAMRGLCGAHGTCQRPQTAPRVQHTQGPGVVRMRMAPAARTRSRCAATGPTPAADIAASGSSTADELLSGAGCAPYQVERLLRELERASIPPADVAARVDVLRAVFPPAHLAELLYNGGADLLGASPEALRSSVPGQLLALQGALGLGADAVASMVARQPRLLQMPEAKVSQVLKALVRWWPKAKDKKGEMMVAVQEYPELLVRATYYLDDARIRTYTDLPVDLQNRMLRTACG